MPRIKYGYVYVDQGDSCDGYPRVFNKLFDDKEECRKELLEDVNLNLKNHNLTKRDLKSEGDVYYIEDVCCWKIFEIEV